MDPMRIVSINIGNAESIGGPEREIVTGINKRPVAGGVFIGSSGLPDDAICDEESHGGVDQAVYAYSANDYAWWSQQLGHEIAPGTFGENLTIEGLPTNMNAGDRLLFGDVILEATAPRIPCGTFGAWMQDSDFSLSFRRAQRPGIYFRVLNEGNAVQGASVTLVEGAAGNISMLELMRLYYEIRPSADALRRALDAPIAIRLRDKLAKKLAAANSD